MTDTTQTEDSLSPGARIARMSGGLPVSRMLHLVVDRGIADLLVHGPRSSERLAEATGLHDLSLYRVLRALATLGVFTELPGRRFELTEVGETLVAGHPSAAREAVLFRTGDLAWQV
jgi:hypothetical protein